MATKKKTKRIVIRLSDEDYTRLEGYSRQVDIPMAQLVREYIKKLPAVRDE